MPVTLTIPQVIARLQREMAGDKLVMRMCDELLRRRQTVREDTLRAAITAISYADDVGAAIGILEDMRENSNAVR